MALRQLAFQQARGVTFDLRFELGMTHSVYIHDPDGYGPSSCCTSCRARYGRTTSRARFRLDGGSTARESLFRRLDSLR